ncbi:MAG: carboxypeptidase regulatory-like domain-containing protein [Phycisphaerales bacterium]|nr:carboxypeptidase regulatory-like domain-containing protein [Phycisphaerales bacterium]
MKSIAHAKPSIRRIRLLAAAVMLFPCLPPLAPAQEPPTPSPARQDAKLDDKSVVLVEGQVINFIGGGERDVKVTLHRKAADGTLGEPLASTTTDGMGDFKLVAAAQLSGEAVVRILKTGYAPMLKDVKLGEGEFPPFVDAALEGEYVLSGKVADARDSAAIVEAEVTVKTPFREWNGKTREGGKFRFEGLYPGDVEVVVRAKGFGRESQKIEILPDGNELSLLLKPERVVRLKTVDESGKPVSGAIIECYDAERDDFRNTATDKEGSAVLTGVHFDAAGFKLRVTHPDFISDAEFSREIALPVGQVESLHELRLSRAGRVIGQVIDAATRKPLSDARLIAGPQITDFASQAFSDVEGKFTLKSLPPGKLRVTVYRAGSAPEMTEVEVASGEEKSILVKLGPPRDITGTVLDAADKPVAEAFLETRAWRGGDTLTLRTVSDEKGRFTLLDAPLDEFELTATSREGASGRAKVPADHSEVTISLTEARQEPPSRQGRGPAAGAAAPDFQVTTLEGKTLKLSDLKGKVVLLDFWATWCGPCVAEVPNLVKVRESFATREDFVMISISLDRDENALTKFAGERKMTWHHVFGEKGNADATAEKFGVYAIPALFLIDREGKIIATDLRGPDIQKKVTEALDAKSP